MWVGFRVAETGAQLVQRCIRLLVYLKASVLILWKFTPQVTKEPVITYSISIYIL